MKMYAILRRAGWSDAASLRASGDRSLQVAADEMSDEIDWIRSYVIEDVGDTVGTICIYHAASPEAVREHAARVGLPTDEILAVADVVVIRPDPEVINS